MLDATIIIPARYASTRFPGKPLALLDGQSVIARVVKAALKSRAARPVFVATDDERIQAEVESQFSPEDARVVLTTPDCHTGTDRLAEAVRVLNLPLERHIVVNVQGDEPFLDPTHVDALLDLMRAQSDLRMATLATPLADEAQFLDPNVVKVVVSSQSRALYFSRAAIPFDRENTRSVTPLRHLGIYAYHASWLLEMASLPPSPLEECEKLEQLRALEAGVSIGVAVVQNVVPIAIDTPEDLKRAHEYLEGLTAHSLD